MKAQDQYLLINNEVTVDFSIEQLQNDFTKEPDNAYLKTKIVPAAHQSRLSEAPL